MLTWQVALPPMEQLLRYRMAQRGSGSASSQAATELLSPFGAMRVTARLPAARSSPIRTHAAASRRQQYSLTEQLRVDAPALADTAGPAGAMERRGDSASRTSSRAPEQPLAGQRSATV